MEQMQLACSVLAQSTACTTHAQRHPCATLAIAALIEVPFHTSGSVPFITISHKLLLAHGHHRLCSACRAKPWLLHVQQLQQLGYYCPVPTTH